MTQWIITIFYYHRHHRYSLIKITSRIDWISRRSCGCCPCRLLSNSNFRNHHPEDSIAQCVVLFVWTKKKRLYKLKQLSNNAYSTSAPCRRGIVSDWHHLCTYCFVVSCQKTIGFCSRLGEFAARHTRYPRHGEREAEFIVEKYRWFGIRLLG